MSDPYYSYIFVRQDISPEQQLIQFGHVCCVMGKYLPSNVCPHSLHFVGIGVRDEFELTEVIDLIRCNNQVAYFFQEPDINGEITAVASSPVKGECREAFSSFQTLKFNY
jgi:hypothetical protein